ncbi:PQQ-dependent sugar dehydrogenase [Candidatus Kaiserbacteria bacterium]|nr:PQQ-dependent sugar dehydrogenase [Candidatus Kaiserbacteria bacterium]
MKNTKRFGSLYYSFLCAIILINSMSPSLAQALTAPAGFQVNTVISGLNLPTSFVFVPDGRIFIGEKGGTVRVYKNGQLLPTPLIRLPDVNDYGDRGLESIAIDPNFAQNGYIYLSYTYENTPGQNYEGFKTGRIVRFTVVGDTADFNTRVVILGKVGGDASKPSCTNFAVGTDCILSDASTHSMGDMHFGSDGKLYATIGDGAGFLTVDPKAMTALDIQTLAGKIVRINTDGTGPADNPFYSGNPNDNRSKVWATGLRNSYRFSFRPTDGKMFFGDVGWGAWEEVNIGIRGANYGWPCREGFDATSYNCTPSTPWTNPIYVFDHHTSTGSVMGGVFPPTSAYPAQYAGNYFFGDYSNDLIKRMVLSGSDTMVSVEDFITDAGGPVGFVLGPDGTIYYAAINVGEIRRMVFSSANRAPIAQIAANPVSGVPPLTVHFTGSGSSDPDSNPITYKWNFGDGSSVSTAANPDHVYQSVGTFTVTLTVTDSLGAQGVATTNIVVSNTPMNDAAPHMTQTIGAPLPPNVVGRDVLITSTIRNTGAASPFIIDMEIYNTSGVKVAQKLYENQIIPTNGQVDYSLNWFPGTIGDYTVKIGLFKAGWAGTYEWNDQALVLHILDRAGTTEPVFSQTTSAASLTPAPGTSDLITTRVTNTGGAGSALVDIEIWKDGAKVGQQFYNNQSFAANQTIPLTYNFPVPTSGTYKVSVGIFKPNWTGLYSWHDSVLTLTTGTSGGVIPIYLDALASGVDNWSWNSIINFADTSLVSEGTKSLKVTYQAPWAGMYLHKVIDTTGKGTLNFAIAGAGTSGQNIQVYTYDAAGNPLTVKNLSAYVPGGIVNGFWKQVSIPLADLGALNKTIQGIVFQDASGGSGASVNIDNIRIQ